MPEKVSVVTLGCENDLIDCEFMSGLEERYNGHRGVNLGCSPFDAPEIDGEQLICGCHAEIGEIRRVGITHAYEYHLSEEGIA